MRRPPSAANSRATKQGEDVRRAVSAAAARAEDDALSAFSDDDVERLRRMLFDLIDDRQDPGSCL